ncbi:MAG: polysaccharide deacetylase family protein [Myxococcales bacterium]|nr:polysaccharide deacetylase family protein [Myxococcales bacterium]MCB9577249.1 polysaccharide deacetylase family protein [Polyangiaceae bacterium]
MARWPWLGALLFLLGCGGAVTPRTKLVATSPAVLPAPRVHLARLTPPGPARLGAGVRRLSAEPAARRFREPVVAPEHTRAIVLLYHGFDDGRDKLSVKSSAFERQLGWLADNHVEIVSTSELLDYLEGRRWLPERVAVITIDDGRRSVFRRAWPILARHGARFTVGLPTGVLSDPKNAPVMSWSEVRQMVASGLCEVASHGHMHRSLPKLEGKKLAEELNLSRRIIERETGRPPVAYFYPLGAFDRGAARQVERAGYRAAFRASGAPVTLGSGSRFWLPRASVVYRQGGVIAQYFDDAFADGAVARRAP